MAGRFMERTQIVEAAQIVNVCGLLHVHDFPYPEWIKDLFENRGIGNIKGLFYEKDESNPAFPKLCAYCINPPDIIDLEESDWLVRNPDGGVSLMDNSSFKAKYQRVIND